MKPDNIQEEHGHALRTAVEIRRDELELRLAQLQNSDRQGTAEPLAIESALSMLDQLLPEEHIDLSPVVAERLMRWLDANKFLGILDRKNARGARAH
jgi:hypothetical protein